MANTVLPRIVIASESRDYPPAPQVEPHLSINGTIRFVYDGRIAGKAADIGDLTVKRSRVKRILDRLLKRPFDARKEALMNYLKDFQPDIILAEYGGTGAYLVPICKELGIPLTVYFRGQEAYEYSILEELKEDYQELFKYASKIFVVSKHMGWQLEKLGAPAEKIVHNPSAPNRLYEQIEAKYDSPYFIANGRFTDKKAQYYLVMSFAKVAAKNVEVRLKLIGDGFLLNSVRNIASALGVSDRIEFLGKLSADAIRKQYQDAFCFIQHSIVAENGDSEGTPLALMEAAMAGFPVVSSKHAGIPEVIQHGENGYLVDEHDVERMAEYMLEIANNRRLAKEMGMKNRQFAKENYQIDRHLSRINQAIAEVLSNKT